MTRDGVRAVALAAIMVLSMVAVGAGFAGSAVAQDAGQGEVILLNQSDETVGSFDSIQAAVDDASEENDTIVVGPGTYEEALTIDVEGLTIEGPNSGLPGDSDERGAEAVVSLSDSEEVSVTATDVEIDGLAFEFAEVAIYSESGSSDSLYTNNRFEMPDGESSDGYAIRIEGDTTGTDVTDNLFTDIESTDGLDGDNVNGVVVRDPNETTISGNTFDSVDTAVNVGNNGPTAGELVVTNNEFTDISQFGAVALNNPGSELNVDVQDNEINASRVGIAVYAGNSAATFSIQDNEFAGFDDAQPYVNDGYAEVLDLDQVEANNEFASDPVVGATAITPPASENTVLNVDSQETYSDIQSALDDVSAGDTISVGSGTYEGAIDVAPDNVTIKGPNSGISGDSDDRSAEAKVTVTGGTISGENVTVDGLQFTEVSSKLVEVTGAGTTFENNRVETDGTSTVRFQPEATGAVVSSNLFNGSGGNWVINAHQGDAPVEGVEITHNAFRNAEDGIIQAKYTDGVISGNTFENIASDAVRLTGDINGTAITNNTFDSTGQSQPYGAILANGVDSGVNVTISNNQFEDPGDGVFVATNARASPPGLDLSDILQNQNNTFAPDAVVSQGAIVTETAVDVVNVDQQTGFNEIQNAVNAANSGETIEIGSGTFNENVDVTTENITIVGQGDETTINGSIALDTADLRLSDVRIESEVGDVFPNPADQNNAINVAGSNVTVSDVTVDLSVESAEGSEGIAVEVYGDDASATITNATIDGTGEMTADGLTAVVGVSADDGAAATIRDSDIDVASDGYSFAVVARNGATTDVRGNVLSASGGELNGVGFGVEGDNPEAQTVRFNTFDDIETIENKAASGEFDVTGNYWTDLADVEFINTNDGEITYDPFLTVEPSELNATSLGETTNFGHDLVVPADGTPHSVAFPAPVEGNVSEVFGEFNGTVFAYDGDGWESGSEIADEDVGALDAFVVKVDEDESDLRIAFEYAASDAQYPTSTDLEEGWNFVGAPESGNSTDAFDVTTTNIQTVSHINAGAGSQPYGASSTAPFATNPDSVSPFQGYWVFVTDDGELGATVPVGPTQSNEEGALAGN